MTANRLPAVRLTSLSHGAGCACKLPLAALEQVMGTLSGQIGPAAGALLVGAAEGDDAAVYQFEGGPTIVLTTDFFTPIVDDPFEWGRVAAANALSDVYAMGGRPLLALNLVAWPAATLELGILAEVLRGGATVASGAGCLVVGGHTVDDPEPKYGMAVVGQADPARILSVAAASPGDALVLTKAIGTGVVATAIKRGDPDPAEVRAAVGSMVTLNAGAGEAALAAGVRAATDVTGYGLLGHAHRMLRASGVAGEIDASAVELLPGAERLAEEGFVSGGTLANQKYLEAVTHFGASVRPVLRVLLCDAQTSGGLLLAVPEERLGRLIAELERRDVRRAVIGRVVEGVPGLLAVS